MRFVSVAIGSVRSSSMARIAASMAAGSISGSSPWMLTITAHPDGGRDFGHPVRAGEVVGLSLRTFAPKPRAHRCKFFGLRWR